MKIDYQFFRTGLITAVLINDIKQDNVIDNIHY